MSKSIEEEGENIKNNLTDAINQYQERANGEEALYSIEHSEYVSLVGLLHLAHTYNGKLADIEDAIVAIVGKSDHVYDAVYQGYSALELLDRLQIEVVRGD